MKKIEVSNIVDCNWNLRNEARHYKWILVLLVGKSNFKLLFKKLLLKLNIKI